VEEIDLEKAAVALVHGVLVAGEAHDATELGEFLGKAVQSPARRMTRAPQSVASNSASLTPSFCAASRMRSSVVLPEALSSAPPGTQGYRFHSMFPPGIVSESRNGANGSLRKK